MFGRKKDEEGGTRPHGATSARPQAEATPAGATPMQRPGAKNRPTPKRRDAQAARLHPLVPADRKAAEEAAKEADRSDRVKRQEAMRRGEQWALLPRDKGPERAWMRDVVDARWNVGEFLLPLMLVTIPLTLLGERTTTLAMAGFALVYGVMLVFFVDVAVVWLRLRRRHLEKFGVKPASGAFFYVMSRMLNIRRFRLPLPRVARGAEVD